MTKGVVISLQDRQPEAINKEFRSYYIVFPGVLDSDSRAGKTLLFKAGNQFILSGRSQTGLPSDIRKD
jgi:hypothetical protein